VSHGTKVYQRATAPLVLRSHAQVAALFDGFDLVEPGLVQVPLWRPDDKRPRLRDLAGIGIYGGVGQRRSAGGSAVTGPPPQLRDQPSGRPSAG
jgi:S-adenosyl methyltransferase